MGQKSVDRAATTTPCRSCRLANRKVKTVADRLLSVDEVCAELNVARSTWNEWRAKRKAPECVTLPSRSLRVRRSELDRWRSEREDAA